VPAVSLPAPAQFGTHARLYGYTLDASRTGDGADATVTLHLYWEIMQPLLPPHHIFVHADTPDGVTRLRSRMGRQSRDGAGADRELAAG
jgi:hypothetical protein